jgi:hypothetical protein
MSAAEKKAMARRGKMTSGTGIGRLQDALAGKKNSKGVQKASPSEAESVRHRLELKYPKDYSGGGAAPVTARQRQAERKKKKGK